MRTNEKGIAQWLSAHDDIAILTHYSPDGDALGSTLAMLCALRAKGKRACAVCQDEVPPRYHILPHWEEIVRPDALPFTPRAILAVDCGDEGRMGAAQALLKGRDMAVVDHHAINRGYVQVCFLDGDAAAAGELIEMVIGEMGVSLTREMAECLYTAIATDTGNFSFSNVSAGTFRAAARMKDAGADTEELNFQLFRKTSAARVHLMGRALSGLRYLDGGDIALMRLWQKDFEETGAIRSDAENLVNFGVETENVKVAIQATEQADGIRFSLRSRGTANVAEIAGALGGGGHEMAAGVTLPLPMDEAVEKVVSQVRRALR